VAAVAKLSAQAAALSSAARVSFFSGFVLIKGMPRGNAAFANGEFDGRVGRSTKTAMEMK
jgi:hypothetical protein